MTQIIAVVNQKGGVGKTTTSINLAAALAAEKYKTLIIDADPQGNSSSGLGINKNELKLNFYHFLIEKASIHTVIQETTVPLLHILPANSDLIGVEMDLIQTKDKETHFKNILNQELPNLNYDFIIIDSPPNLNTLSINIMAAAQKLIIPTPPEYLPLEGLADLTNTFKRLRATVNPTLTILGVLITMYMNTNNLSKEVTKNIKANMGDLVFETIIPKNVRLAEAPSFCLPISIYDSKSTGAQGYKNLALEVIKRCGVNRKRTTKPKLSNKDNI